MIAPEIRAALASGRITSRQLVQQYLTRMALYEDKLNAIITVNPNALAQAEAKLALVGNEANADRAQVRGAGSSIESALCEEFATDRSIWRSIE